MYEFASGRQKLDVASAAARRRFVAKAAAWTRDQSERLGVSEEELLAAIRERGWLPEDIEKLPASQAYQLTRSPIVATLAAAPIVPVVPDSGDRDRRRDRYVSGELRTRDGTNAASLLKEKAA